MALFLAVDAGGTKTEFLLADETRELARVRTGTIKRMRTDAATAEHHLDTALAELSRSAGVALHAVTRTCIGAAGWTVPTVADWMRVAFTGRLRGELVIVGDVEIALDAAFRGGAGVLVLAGTGSNVAGRSLAGAIMTVGGWGPVLADQGSGHRIGQQALRDTFLAVDEQQETVLLPAILEHWKLRSLEDLIEHVHRAPGPDLSQLARLVADAAAAGDTIARKVFDREATDLAHLAELMLGRVYGPPPPLAGLPEKHDPSAHRDASDGERLAFAGSIMEHITPVREGIVARLQRRRPALQVTPSVVDPLLGALWRARAPKQ